MVSDRWTAICLPDCMSFLERNRVRRHVKRLRRIPMKNSFWAHRIFLTASGWKPEKRLSFPGDAVFDTRYVSNAVLSRTGSRYINGLGSDTEQMRYLMDNAARQQKGLGLEFGVALTAEQIAQLDGSILWWSQSPSTDRQSWSRNCICRRKISPCITAALSAGTTCSLRVAISPTAAAASALKRPLARQYRLYRQPECGADKRGR